ncbi:MAG: hypothetical protein JNJ46_22320 [Myxococcales bacterium]|nr:hypothetical protein [Myxococcales bacterium]
MAESDCLPSSPDMAPPQPHWKSCGTHRFYTEGDVVLLQIRGPASTQELSTLLSPIWDVQQEHGRSFVLVDAREAVPISAEQRRFLADWYRRHPTQGRSIIFGANIVLRATVALLNAAARLVSGRTFVQELFVASEDDAWSALREERRKLMQSAANSPSQD